MTSRRRRAPGERQSLALVDWPEADRLAWVAATRPPRDVFDDSGRASRWALSSRRMVQNHYGCWLGHIARTEPEALALDPDARASPPRVIGFLAHLSLRVGSVSQHIITQCLRKALNVIVPGWDGSELDRLVARLEQARRPRPKRPRLVTTGRLLALGHGLMDGVSAGPEPTADDMLAYRDGLMIALLAARPLRRRNFAAIEIGRHLIPVGAEFQLLFDGSETKTGQPIETEVPADLVPRLARYLTIIRPRFPGADTHCALWAGFKRGGLGGQAIYDIIARRTKTAFGHVVNPHLFRDCAATTIAVIKPGQIGVARDLLGHASINTTNAYYNQARSLEASRLHATILSVQGKMAASGAEIQCGNTRHVEPGRKSDGASVIAASVRPGAGRWQMD